MALYHKRKKDKLLRKGELDEGSGCRYLKDGIEMVEYHVYDHVDNHVTFHNDCKNLSFGSNLSIRKPSDQRPAMIIGQDECIFC